MSALNPLGVASILAAAVLARYVFRRRKPPLPPGPKGLPLLGNIFDLPKESPWLGFAEIGSKWGDIFSITVLGQTMVIINSAKVAEDLLDVKGAIFSDRPVIPMGGELVGFRHSLSLSQYGDRVRKERKLFHQLFGTHKAMERFVPLHGSEIHKYLKYLLRNPQGAVEGIRKTTGAIVMRIAYGYYIAEEKDPFLELFEQRAEIFTRSTLPSGFLVNLIPGLRYWPEWLPGGGFRAIAKAWASVIQQTADVPHEYVKQDMATGSEEPSFTSTLLQERPDEAYLIKWAASSIQAGGTSTTSSQIEAFFLAMSVFPDVQAEAQRELDRVVGTDRLPELSDRPDLPYVDALCKEVLRWHNAAPTGIPHKAREDFIYEREGSHPALLIPKGSLLIANLWQMTHDPTVYLDPLTFNPSRFIPTETREAEQDPSRICKFLADTSIFMTCSMVLATFNISKLCNDGIAVEPRMGQTTGTVSQPFPFECILTPRNAQAAALVRDM
ncbi:cytochrome P450 [Mycena crocata]|nr:cytochrome P450 [Mycena crocata]